MVRSNPETALVIIGSLGGQWSAMCCKLGHRVEKVFIVEATSTLERPCVSNVIPISMVPGETNKGMKGANSAVVERNSRVLRFGSKGPLKLKCCKTKHTSGVTPFKESNSVSFRILRAYFRKRASSGVVSSLLKHFQMK